MLIGNLGSSRRASVDGSGRVVFDLPSGHVQLAWWVKAVDRWRLPAEEITCRQALVGDAPIVRTSLRVPGGDLECTVFACRQGQRELACLDLVNRSSAPVVVAFVISGPGARAVSVDDATVSIAGEPFLYLARPPRGVVHTPFDGIDRTRAIRDAVVVRELVGNEGAEPDDVLGASAEVETALLFPLAHTVGARVAVLLGSSGVADRAGVGARPVLEALPSTETVAAGWRVHAQHQPALVLPDGELGAGLVAHAHALSLLTEVGEGGSAGLAAIDLAALLSAAARCGVDGRVDSLVDTLVAAADERGRFDDVSTTAHVLDAVLTRFLFDASGGRRDRSGSRTLVDVTGAALEDVARRSSRAGEPRLMAVARRASWMLARWNEPKAARDAERLWVRAGSPWPLPDRALPTLAARSEGGSLVPDQPRRLAAAIEQTLRQVVDERGDGGLAVLSSFPESWRGQGLEVHRVPSHLGKLSFALRWHGDRPALLWELTEARAPLRLFAPALDRAWSSDQPAGEVLLTSR